MTPYNSIKEALLDYEVRSAWWPGFLSNDTLQNLAAKYFAWKVNRKYRRYQASLAEKREVEMRGERS